MDGPFSRNRSHIYQLSSFMTKWFTFYNILVKWKETVWIHRPFSYNFWNISTMPGWLFTEGTNLFRGALGWQWHWRNFGIFEQQYADSDCDSQMISRLSLQLLFLKYLRIIQKAFLTNISQKDTKHRGNGPEVFHKVNVL